MSSSSVSEVRLATDCRITGEASNSERSSTAAVEASADIDAFFASALNESGTLA